ncbi:hypothetical protein QBC38DRAFT_100157 [Podospora fimiseda]|uniref:Uncharacterized protein n=1 Tax=Podospora fimiseda TaxID=252190 RepID=A0AAN6YQC2_9PEZI|nr:hypothetical protein QBC38DRAFT_100157 [Podospora fimiseda]
MQLPSNLLHMHDPCVTKKYGSGNLGNSHTSLTPGDSLSLSLSQGCDGRLIPPVNSVLYPNGVEGFGVPECMTTTSSKHCPSFSSQQLPKFGFLPVVTPMIRGRGPSDEECFHEWNSKPQFERLTGVIISDRFSAAAGRTSCLFSLCLSNCCSEALSEEAYSVSFPSSPFVAASAVWGPQDSGDLCDTNSLGVLKKIGPKKLWPVLKSQRKQTSTSLLHIYLAVSEFSDLG